MRQILRYSNRKLYDTADHKYITLSDLFNLVHNGTLVQVLDHKTKIDITYQTLLSAMFNKENQVIGDTELLTNAIQFGNGTLTNCVKEFNFGLNKVQI